MGGVKQTNKTPARARVRTSRKAMTPHLGPTHSALHDECWSVIATAPTGIGFISSGLTHEDARATVDRLEAQDYSGSVITTDAAANRIGVIKPGEVFTRRDSRTSLVRDGVAANEQ